MPTIDPTLASRPAPTPSPAARPQDNFGKDAFLKLLVAQLRYQDPLNPAEGGEFIAQTAQFTVVERIEELAKQNAELVAGQRALAGSTLVGRNVTYTDAEGGSRAGTVSAVHLTADGPVVEVAGERVPLSALGSITAHAKP